MRTCDFLKRIDVSMRRISFESGPVKFCAPGAGRVGVGSRGRTRTRGSILQACLVKYHTRLDML